ncbi:hypothetical protein C8T65DRAFT_65737 [Cerioporus squamosus]|nr:hypothetical protein C8T65DRAFT_65737 [Cerioporus squamosus]
MLLAARRGRRSPQLESLYVPTSPLGPGNIASAPSSTLRTASRRSSDPLPRQTSDKLSLWRASFPRAHQSGCIFGVANLPSCPYVVMRPSRVATGTCVSMSAVQSMEGRSQAFTRPYVSSARKSANVCGGRGRSSGRNFAHCSTKAHFSSRVPGVRQHASGVTYDCQCRIVSCLGETEVVPVRSPSASSSGWTYAPPRSRVRRTSAHALILARNPTKRQAGSIEITTLRFADRESAGFYCIRCIQST